MFDVRSSTFAVSIERTMTDPGKDILADRHDPKARWGVAEVMAVAAPAAMGMINVTIMQIVDRLMVARLISPRALAAAFVAGILTWVPISTISGITSSVNTFVAQNLGAGRTRRCGQYAWQGLYLAIACGLMLWLLAPWADEIFRGIAKYNEFRGGKGTNPEELQLQREYFQVIIVGGVFRLMCGALERYFFGTHRMGVVYVTSFVAMLLNIGLNYVLITGAGPWPELGMTGAAMGTVIAWMLEFAMLLVWFLRADEDRLYATRRMWRLRVRRVWDLIRVGFPAGVNWGLDLGCWSYFNAALVGYFGEIHKAASASAVQYMHMSFMPAVGMSIACQAVVGRHIGKGRPEVARKRVHTAFLITAGYTGLCALTFLLFRQPMIELFVSMGSTSSFTAADTAECIRIGTTVLLLAAVFQLFDGMGITFIGALRGAGDTLWPMLIMAGLNLTVMVAGGHLMIAYADHLESMGPWIAATVYIIMFGLVMAWRFESGAWRKIDLLGRRPSVAAPPAELVPTVPAVAGPTQNNDETTHADSTG